MVMTRRLKWIEGLVLAAVVLTGGTAGAEALPPVIETTPAAPAPPVRTAKPTVPVVADKKSYSDLEQRLKKIERVMASGTLVTMFMRLDELQAQVGRLQGLVEEQGHAIEALSRHQRELFSDVDRRLTDQAEEIRRLKTEMTVRPVVQKSEATAETGAPVPSAEGESVQSGGETVAETPAPTLDESSAYEAAWALLRKREYAKALKAFTAFLERFPTGPYSANAQYWIGEASYAMRHYEDAIKAFTRVETQFPDSQKVAAAMLKKAFSHYELKHWDEARQLLEAVIKRFPDGSVAQLAEKRLHRMKIEGH